MKNKTLLYWLFQFIGWGFILFIGFINDYQKSDFNLFSSGKDALIILFLGIGSTHLYRNYIRLIFLHFDNTFINSFIISIFFIEKSFIDDLSSIV